MEIALRHGLTGEQLLSASGSEETMLTGWEITVQLASLLKIATPFHAILCGNGEKIAPFQTLEMYIVNGICELTFVLRQGRPPSVRQYESLIGAIQLKNPTTLCNLLGQGLDLSPAYLCGGRPHVMLALAILRDDDREDYLAYRETSNIRPTRAFTCL